MKKVESLTPSLLEEYPVWRWDDTQEWHVPVTKWQPLEKDEPTYFIKTSFRADDETTFEGYLVGLEPFFAFALFVGSSEFVFNLNLPEIIESNTAAIKEMIGKESLKLFPLSYKTEVYFVEGEKISGKISL